MPDPSDKWTKKVKINGKSSDEVLQILNREYAAGSNTVLAVKCDDGEFLFFGRYE